MAEAIEGSDLVKFFFTDRSELLAMNRDKDYFTLPIKTLNRYVNPAYTSLKEKMANPQVLRALKTHLNFEEMEKYVLALGGLAESIRLAGRNEFYFLNAETLVRYLLDIHEVAKFLKLLQTLFDSTDSAEKVSSAHKHLQLDTRFSRIYLDLDDIKSLILSKYSSDQYHKKVPATEMADFQEATKGLFNFKMLELRDEHLEEEDISSLLHKRILMEENAVASVEYDNQFLECAECRSPTENKNFYAMQLRCRHIFCYDCIVMRLELSRNRFCPLCYRRIDTWITNLHFEEFKLSSGPISTKVKTTSPTKPSSSRR